MAKFETSQEQVNMQANIEWDRLFEKIGFHQREIDHAESPGIDDKAAALEAEKKRDGAIKRLGRALREGLKK